MAILGLIKQINSAHGKHIHGHTFKIEIQFEGMIKNDMVENIDFHEIEPIVNEVISKLDKVYIDDVINTRATVENIAIYIISGLKQQVASLYSVAVWEGLDKYAKVLASEIE